MKHFTEKISLFIVFVLCLCAIFMIACAAQPAPENKPVEDRSQSDISSVAQMDGSSGNSSENSSENSPENSSENSSESSSQSVTDTADKSGAVSALDPMNKENINKSLQIFGKGMVAIFAVIIIIIIVVMIVQKVIAALTAPPKNE